MWSRLLSGVGLTFTAAAALAAGVLLLAWLAALAAAVYVVVGVSSVVGRRGAEPTAEVVYLADLRR